MDSLAGRWMPPSYAGAVTAKADEMGRAAIVGRRTSTTSRRCCATGPRCSPSSATAARPGRRRTNASPRLSRASRTLDAAKRHLPPGDNRSGPRHARNRPGALHDRQPTVLRLHAEQAFARGAGGAARRRTPSRAVRSRPLEALALGRLRPYLLGGEAARTASRSRPSTSARRLMSRSPSPRWPPTARCCCSACPARRRPGSPSTWPPRSPATRRCWSRAPRAPPRRRSATAGTTRGCWPRVRRATRWCPAR